MSRVAVISLGIVLLACLACGLARSGSDVEEHSDKVDTNMLCTSKEHVRKVSSVVNGNYVQFSNDRERIENFSANVMRLISSREDDENDTRIIDFCQEKSKETKMYEPFMKRVYELFKAVNKSVQGVQSGLGGNNNGSTNEPSCKKKSGLAGSLSLPFINVDVSNLFKKFESSEGCAKDDDDLCIGGKKDVLIHSMEGNLTAFDEIGKKINTTLEKTEDALISVYVVYKMLVEGKATSDVLKFISLTKEGHRKSDIIDGRKVEEWLKEARNYPMTGLDVTKLLIYIGIPVLVILVGVIIFFVIRACKKKQTEDVAAGSLPEGKGLPPRSADPF